MFKLNEHIALFDYIERSYTVDVTKICRVEYSSQHCVFHLIVAFLYQSSDCSLNFLGARNISKVTFPTDIINKQIIDVNHVIKGVVTLV